MAWTATRPGKNVPADGPAEAVHHPSNGATYLVSCWQPPAMPPKEADLGNEDLDVSVADDGLVVRATIDRADKRNALNENVLRGLLDVCEYADGADARVVVVRGAGGGFSSGGDFTEMPLGGSVQEYREGFSGLAMVVERLRETAALTVAAVEGFCLAGGLGLAAACDFVVAAEGAEFGTPEVDVGLFPAQAMVPIMRTVHQKRGLKLLFTGEKIPASEAREMGLVTDVYVEDFDAELDAFVDTLADNSPVMVQMGKEAYYEQSEMAFDRALAYAKEVIALMAMSEDTEEGIEAFMMDREPEWRGR
jgi:enoyl-CoA hydratase/carnithine racemase